MMDEPVSADAVSAAVELVLLQGLVESVTTKAERVRSELIETRRHLQEVARLSEDVLAEVRPPNPVRADMEKIHAGALALLVLPSMSFLDY
jgi:hypothetical protein